MPEFSDPLLDRKAKETLNIGKVGTDCVRRPSTFALQVAPKAVDCILKGSWQ
ncbi:hypothetical protein StoSoilB22_24760 [Arthrobacter sp. StoSoilB22]|nr:hypothetical protein StoSoilB22_24760 [Arthrobacter sp. StoSoilB22]